MQIEINQAEIDLIDKALQAWESEATTGALMGNIFSTMLCPKEEREKEEGRRNESMDKATREATTRRVKATMLRAKLFQAANRASEFEMVVS